MIPKTKEEIRKLIKEYGEAEWEVGVYGQMEDVIRFDKAKERSEICLNALYSALEL